MKKIILSLLMTGLIGLAFSAGAQNPPDDNNPNAPGGPNQPAPPPGDETVTNAPDAGGLPPMPPDAADAAEATNNVAPEGNPNGEPVMITPSQSKAGPQEEYQSNFVPPQEAGTNYNDLNLNFNRAPLEQVLNYLSDAAGFIIVLETRISSSATVTINGKHLTRNEAADLVNSVLNKNGYAAIRDGRTLTILDKNDAKTRGIPVNTGNNPDLIPNTAEIVTQIIPIRFVEARQLVSDLSSFVSPQATVVANEAGNSIVITDTQANIRHLAEIIKAVDDSAEAETEIRVFRLKYASPSDVAAEITSVFPSSTSGNTAQAPTRFGGGGGFFARMMGGGGGGQSSSGSNDRIKKATQVNAVADARIQAVIVTAPKDLIEEIAGMMKDLDVPSDRDQDVYVFKSNNGDPQQIAQVLQSMFQTTQSRNNTSASQTSALQQRAQTTTTTTSQTTSSSGFGSTTGGGGVRGGNLP
jgi:type II secretory pathway component GspD/PulD (secretin)